MNEIKQMIFNNWHLMRIVRLAIGIFIGINAIIMHEALPGIIAAIFLFQAITNTGCCAGSCALPSRKANNQNQSNTLFEKIKND